LGTNVLVWELSGDYMITAQQAREISGPDAQVYLDFIEKKIKEAAEKKKFEVIISENPYARWLYSERDLSDQPKKAIKILRDNGFKVDLYYSEGSQFVDMGLRINW
jgi:hypothetical protein